MQTNEPQPVLVLVYTVYVFDFTWNIDTHDKKTHIKSDKSLLAGREKMHSGS